MTRFCHISSPRVDALIATILQRVAAEVGAFPDADTELAAVVLGGGYGRGDGGVTRSADGTERPYNDLDLFVFVPNRLTPGACAKWTARLKEIEVRLSAEYGFEVEFGPLTTLARLKRLAPTLMIQELLRGWQPVWGDAARVLRPIPLLPLDRIPPDEALRLLLNRGAGPLLSREKIAAASGELAPEDADFCTRNAAKAALAIGDVRLLLRGEYDFSPDRRLAILNGSPDFSATVRHNYQLALEFKYRPYSASLPEPAEWCRTIESLWLEAAEELKQCIPVLLPVSPLELLKNFVHNTLYTPDLYFRYQFQHPRQQIFLLLENLLLDKTRNRLYFTASHRKGYECPDLQKKRFFRLWRRFN